MTTSWWQSSSRRQGETRSFVDSDSFTQRRTVTSESALRLTSVFAAFRHIVDYVSTLPVDNYRLKGKARTPAPLPQLLATPQAPSPIPYLPH